MPPVTVIREGGETRVITAGQQGPAGPQGPEGPPDATTAAALAVEIARATAVEDALSAAIEQEAEDRQTGDASVANAAAADLADEVAAREAGDTASRNRANHTGTQTLSTISDAGTAAFKNTGTSAGNVPVLDGSAKLPVSTIPSIAVTEFLGSVASQAAMLALVGQLGDWCVRTDVGKNFVITGSDPSQLSSWTSLEYPAAPVTKVAGKTGDVVLVKGDVGLDQADNTSDADKPVSTAQAAADTASRNRANHTGTQLLSTISDAGTAAARAASAGGNGAADDTKVAAYSNGALKTSSTSAGSPVMTSAGHVFTFAYPSGTVTLSFPSTNGGGLNRSISIPLTSGTVVITSSGGVTAADISDGTQMGRDMAKMTTSSGIYYPRLNGNTNHVEATTIFNVKTDLGITWAPSSVGTGMATWMTTPSSANFYAVMATKTGSGGNVVFSNSPTLASPVLGDATADSLTAVGGNVLINGSLIGGGEAAVSVISTNGASYLRGDRVDFLGPQSVSILANPDSSGVEVLTPVRSGVLALEDMEAFTFSTLPAAYSRARKLLFVSDRGLNGRPAYSDGTNWRWLDDTVAS